ncbi:TPA: tail completion protein gp17 [Serratia fonticola]
MIAPIFAACAGSPAVTALIGSNPVRLYPFGLQDDNIVYPYVVWQGIPGGGPAMYLGTLPDIDSYALQVDVYADTVAETLSVAKALRDAIEPHAYIMRWGDQSRDPQTKRYRYSFDVDWLVKR